MNSIVCARLLAMTLLLMFISCSHDPTEPEPAPTSLSIQNCPASVSEAPWQFTWSYGFTVSGADSGAVDWTATSLSDPPTGGFSVDSQGKFHFFPDSLDWLRTLHFQVKVTSAGKQPDSCRFSIEVIQADPFLIRIGKVYDALQGHQISVPVTVVSGSVRFGGFDLSIGFEEQALTLLDAQPGGLINESGCGWEYFSFRFESPASCGGPCPSGIVRLVALADLAWEPETPSCYDGQGDLAVLKFHFSSAEWECALLPIRFVWLDDGDNTASSISGDTLLTAAEVYDYGWEGDWQDSQHLITHQGCDSGWGFSLGGPCPQWGGPAINPPRSELYFWNGFIDGVCFGPVEFRGDLNLNGLYNEIADAQLYVEYFLEGPSVLEIDLERETWESDLNYDGVSLSVADLVYLLEDITGRARALSHLHPFRDTASVSWQNGLFAIDSPVDIGAVWVTLLAPPDSAAVNHTDMELASGQWFSNELSLLLYPGFEDMTKKLPAGHSNLFTLTGAGQLLSIQVSDRDGNMMTVLVNGSPGPGSGY